MADNVPDEVLSDDEIEAAQGGAGSVAEVGSYGSAGEIGRELVDGEQVEP